MKNSTNSASMAPACLTVYRNGEFVFSPQAAESLRLQAGSVVDVRLNKSTSNDWWLVKTAEAEGMPLAPILKTLLGFRSQVKASRILTHFQCHEPWLVLAIDLNEEREGECVGYSLQKAQDEEETAPTKNAAAA